MSAGQFRISRDEQKSPSIVVYLDDPISPTAMRAEDNTNRSRALGGNTDPTSPSAVQTLLAACITRLTTLGGGHLHFGQGSYAHKSLLTLPANTIVSGCGPSTILDISAASGETNQITMGSGCGLHDIKLLGKSGRYGIGGVQAASNCNIYNLRMDNGLYGVYVPDGTENVFTRNFIGENFRGRTGYEYAAAFHVSGLAKNVHLDGFYFANSDRGVEVEDGPKHCSARNGRMYAINNADTGYSSWALDTHVHNEDDANHIPEDITFENIELDTCAAPFVCNYEPGSPGYCKDVTFRKITVKSPVSSYCSVKANGALLEEISMDTVCSGSYQIVLGGNNVICKKIRLSAGGTGYGIYDIASYSQILECIMPSFQYGGITAQAGSVNPIIARNRIINTDGADGIRVWSEGCTIADNIISGGSSAGIRLSGNNQVVLRNRSLMVSGSFISPGTTTGHIFQNNIGYVGRGEIRTVSGSISGLSQNSFNSVDNPFGSTVQLLSLAIKVSTAATATSPNIDCGIGSSATADYANLFDDLPGETVGNYLSTIATPGAQTQPVRWVTGASNRYLNMSIKDADATGMVATYVATVIGM
jgi:hypothetical protein